MRRRKGSQDQILLLKVLEHKKGLEKLGMEQTGRQEGTEDADRLNSL